jgi:glycosyltransferase involved in cell wall biosynthesis
MCNYEYPPLGGGGGIVHAMIAETLAERHRVCVITSAFRGLPSHEMRNGVEIHRVPVIGRRELPVASLVSMLSYPVTAWLRAMQLLRRERFDIVNAHFAVPTGPGSLAAARLAGLPHVVSIHGGDIYDPSKRFSPHRTFGARRAVRTVLQRSDAVVAQSHNTSDNARRFYDFRGPIEIIPLGIRAVDAPPATRAQLGVTDDVFLAITVGRLVKRKRIEHLLHALARPECASVHLAVVGSGPELDRLRGMAADLDLTRRVRFLGHVSEVEKWQLLRCADAYVSSTMHEGFGLVYLEAMAAGLPVVTPDYGGQVDFLKDGDTGYLVPSGDIPALGAAIARLVAHPTVARRMSEANLCRSVQHRIECCACAYEGLFERVIAVRASSRPPRRVGWMSFTR